MQTWPLQDAKARLSEMVRICNQDGSQMLSVHGETKAVLLSKADYEKLIGAPTHLVDFLRVSSLCGVSLDLERDSSLARDVYL